MTKLRRWTLPGLVLLTVASRLPFLSQVLFNVDSVNFALAVGQFDLAKHRPHPPGYILFVLVGRLLSAVVGDVNTAFVVFNVICGALTVGVTYLLGRAIFGERDGRIAAVLLMTSPLIWFHDVVALSYSVEGLFSVSIAYASYRALQGRREWGYVAVVLLALAGGFRQTSLLFLGPLALLAVTRLPWKHRIPAATLGIVLGLAWLIPLVTLSGGPQAYVLQIYRLSQATPSSSLGDLLQSLFFGGHVALLVIIGYWVGLYRIDEISPSRWHRWFLMLWVLPGLLFSAMRHVGQSGYVLFAMPAVFLYTPTLLRGAIKGMMEVWGAGGSRRGAPLRQLEVLTVVLMMVVGVSGFLLGAYPLIRIQDQRWQYGQTLSTQYSPQRTVVLSDLSRVGGFRFAEYYLPDYRVYGFVSVDLKGPFLVNQTERIIGWVFQVGAGGSDYGLDPIRTRVHTDLRLPSATSGLLMTSGEIAERLVVRGPNGAELIPEVTWLDWGFAYVALPGDVDSLEAVDGVLVLD